MVDRIISRDSDNYVLYLTYFIQNQIVNLGRKITFIDCMNCIHQYMFARSDLHLILENLYLTRIERLYDLYDLLHSIHFDSKFQMSEILLLSGYSHMLDEIDDGDHIDFVERIDRNLARIEERYQKHVVQIERVQKSDTQSRLNGL